MQPSCPAGFLLLGLGRGRLALAALRYVLVMVLTGPIRATEATLVAFERRLGIHRDGRSVWVWALPPAVGLAVAILSLVMPGLPADFGIAERVAIAIFGFFTMTAIAFIYLLSFDNDPNQSDDVPQTH